MGDGRTGVLLINVGSPDSPSVRDVRRYLRAFLSDPRVIDIPALPRWLLLNLVILPFRPRRSAEAYRAIWTEEGSPLLIHSRALQRQVADALGDRFIVELGMRYGSPAMETSLSRLCTADVERIIALPLFPQYASAVTGSAVDHLSLLLQQQEAPPPVEILPPFYNHEAFIAAWQTIAESALKDFAPDIVLFSYHGLPVRQIEKGDPTGSHCFARPDCCETISASNRNCYRAQCLATTKALARALQLERYTSAFQSRMGRDKWIAPDTEEALVEMAQEHKRLAVICPSFVADCLETTEEIGIRAQQTFLDAGGEAFLLVPSLNATPRWAEAVAEMVRQL